MMKSDDGSDDNGEGDRRVVGRMMGVIKGDEESEDT